MELKFLPYSKRNIRGWLNYPNLTLHEIDRSLRKNRGVIFLCSNFQVVSSIITFCLWIFVNTLLVLPVFPRFHLSFSHQRKSPASSSPRSKWKLVPRVSASYKSSVLQSPCPLLWSLVAARPTGFCTPEWKSTKKNGASAGHEQECESFFVPLGLY